MPLKTVGADWRSVYSALVFAVKVRLYSPKTLKAYKVWIHHSQNFVKSKEQILMELSDVKVVRKGGDNYVPGLPG